MHNETRFLSTLCWFICIQQLSKGGICKHIADCFFDHHTDVQLLIRIPFEKVAGAVYRSRLYTNTVPVHSVRVR